MKRKIIHIDESKCNGCGLCVPNCAEGAIQIINGKAKLVSEIFCDGLGACLGHCPVDAIKMEERDAPDFDEKAVHQHLTKMGKTPSHPQPAPQAHQHSGCPGSALRSFQREAPKTKPASSDQPAQESCLSQWPVQLMLVPPSAPFLKDADLVLCADCVPFAVPDFHTRYLEGRAVLVACPKLDDSDYYREKLGDMFRESKPKKITVLRMEVPCCGGLAHIAKEARDESSPQTPLEIHIVGIRGGITVQAA